MSGILKILKVQDCIAGFKKCKIVFNQILVGKKEKHLKIKMLPCISKEHWSQA